MTGTPLRTPAPVSPAPAPHPASTTARTRRKWPFGAVVVLAAGTSAWAIAGRDAPPPAAPTASPAAHEGVFSFVAGKARCGVHAVGPADLSQRPNGMFCLVDVAVTNNGGEAELFDGGPQRALDEQGRRYRVADGAAVFLNTADPTILNEIAPGGTVHGTLPFDVPEGTRITALMLHESMTSNGVRVPLS